MRDTNALIKKIDTPAPDAKIWAIPAIHGELEKLQTAHDAIFETFTAGDQIIYHGNYIGYGTQAASVIDEILTFRRTVLAKHGVRPEDFTYLKGSQEDLWHKLYQLHYAPRPEDVYIWLLGNGVSATLQSYGIDIHDGIHACRMGGANLARWINSIQDKVRKNPGHTKFFSILKNAAYLDDTSPYPMIFVHAGLNSNKCMASQGEAWFWGSEKFESIDTAYKPFEKIVRGYDPAHKGYNMNCIKATIDNGCGFGGDLVATAFQTDGNIAQTFSA